VLDIVRQLQAIDPRIHVFYNGQADEFDLVEDCLDGVQRLIFSCKELDARVVRRILEADHWRGRRDPEHVVPEEEDFLTAIDKDNEALQDAIDEKHRDQLRYWGEELAWSMEEGHRGTKSHIRVERDVDASPDS